ncbi:unnamed protein product [Blepharisma stoltei]|uniref:Uncharacterized protein n=1 Tax=Blepharisma stoltei TaxID=1481888 RepID=A0AAU9KA02_9CILI|nr:unnamed protein product [Blepharisma stoltei]
MKKLDLFTKTNPDIARQTVLGGIFTIFAFSSMLLLFLFELDSFKYPSISKQITIVPTELAKVVNISIDITIPKSPCLLLTVDWQDIIGSYEEDCKSIHKDRIDEEGKNIPGILNLTYENIENAVEDLEGCHIWGTIPVLTVPGNFHIGFHAHENLLHSLPSDILSELSLEHTINSIQIGDEKWNEKIGKYFNNSEIKMKKYFKETFEEEELGFRHEHVMKITPVQYEAENEIYNFYEFSMNSLSSRSSSEVSTIYYRYDFDCISMKYSIEEKFTSQFIITLCSILGGIFSLISFIDILIDKN